MTHNDWKFLKDGEYPEEYRDIWVYYYSNKYDNYYTAMAYMRGDDGLDKWTEDSDESCFRDDDIIIAWQYRYIPERPEFQDTIGGEYVTGVKV